MSEVQNLTNRELMAFNEAVWHWLRQENEESPDGDDPESDEG